MSESNIWPKGYEFAVGLSHDVDETKKTYQYLTHFLKTLRLYHLMSLFIKSEPYWNFEKIMNLEDKYGVRSTFYFLHQRPQFSIKKPVEMIATMCKASFLEEKTAGIIKILDDNDWEIGFHGSFSSFCDKKLIQYEKNLLEEILGKPVWGIRQHYLNLKIPQTWRIQKEVGFKYDASYGSNKNLGFFENKYFPFKPFNDDFVVVPLTIMDYVLLRKGKTHKARIELCRRIIMEAKKKKGMAVILWHQRTFNEEEFPGGERIYEEIIKFSLDQGGWVTTLRDIVQFWNTRI